jgi:hypothetical protein
MNKVKLIALAVIVGLVLSGCNRPHFRTFDIEQSAPTGISLDARQRLVIITDKGGPSKTNV